MTSSDPSLCLSAGSTRLSEHPNPRKRRRTGGGRMACTRCRKRKQKCNDEWPICSNCQKAGVECDKTDVMMTEPPAAYTRALEEQLTIFETRFAELSNQQQRTDATQAPSISATSKQVHVNSNNTFSDFAPLIALGTVDTPAYVGSSSGLSLAINLGEMVQASVWNKTLPVHSSPTTSIDNPRKDFVDESGHCSSGARSMTMAELMANSSKEPPGDELGSSMLRAYFHQLHPRYPFLDPPELWKLHGNRLALAAAPPLDLSRSQRFGIFKLYLVYAIGSTLLKLTEKRIADSPESFYMTALLHIFAARESRTIQNIEMMTLLVIYHLRSASSHGMWYMIGLAMRTCIDLGMHSKGYEHGLSLSTIQKRRRIFWTVYSLERTIAICLGGSFSITDRQIDVEFPIADCERGISDPLVSPVNNLAPSTPLLAIFFFQLRRIESRIHHSIYRMDKPLNNIKEKLDLLYSDLEAWRKSIMEQVSTTTDTSFSPGPGLNHAFLHYHRAVRLLIQPFLVIMSPTDRYYQLCIRAAGDICQTHKRLYSQGYGQSFVAVQTVFVAGATLIHALWTSSNAVWSATLADDIRVCSLMLFAMAERAPWVRKYRDAFEVLVNVAMEKQRSGIESTGIADMAAAQARAEAYTWGNHSWANNDPETTVPLSYKGRGSTSVNSGIGHTKDGVRVSNLV